MFIDMTGGQGFRLGTGLADSLDVLGNTLKERRGQRSQQDTMNAILSGMQGDPVAEAMLASQNQGQALDPKMFESFMKMQQMRRGQQTSTGSSSATKEIMNAKEGLDRIKNVSNIVERMKDDIEQGYGSGTGFPRFINAVAQSILPEGIASYIGNQVTPETTKALNSLNQQVIVASEPFFDAVTGGKGTIAKEKFNRIMEKNSFSPGDTRESAIQKWSNIRSILNDQARAAEELLQIKMEYAGLPPEEQKRLMGDDKRVQDIYSSFDKSLGDYEETKEEPQQTTFYKKPPPGKYKGKSLTDEETGIKYISNGKAWIRKR